MPIFRPQVIMPVRRRGMGAAAPAASYTSAQIQQMIANAANQYGIPPSIALEVAVQESGLNPTAVSSAGAQGVFQLMPATAASLGVTNSFDAQQNINAGVQYLSQLYNKFGSWDQALGAYNWGPGNVSNAINSQGDDWLSTAPSETQNYVSSIMAAAGIPSTVSVTAGSIVSGVSDAASSAVDAITSGSPVDPTTLIYLTGGLILAYIAFDFVSDFVFD